MLTSYATAIVAEYQKAPSPVLTLPSGLTDADFVALAAAHNEFTEVTDLNITSSRNADWASGRLAAFASELPKLSRLNLGSAVSLSDTAVQAIATNLTALSALNLGYCSQVTDVGVQAIATNLTALRTLELRFCNITDVGMQAIATSLTALSTLILRSCSRLTDVGVQAIATNLTALTKLDIDSCSRLTDVGVQAIATNLTALTKLNLGHCTQVTDVGVQAIATNLTALRTLDIDSCSQVTDVGVQAIATNLTALSTLILRCCSRLTDVGVQAIATNLTALTKLNLGHCTQVTDVGVQAIATNLTALRIISLSSMRLGLPEELQREHGDAHAIRAYYLRVTNEGKRTLNEAKLILVGNEAVGKTSLVNFLVHNKPCRDTAKTPGVAIETNVDTTEWAPDDTFVDVKRWAVHKAAVGDTPLKLNVWDFGGQQVLYETHQFFLTARSLYLIVLEARRENVNEQEANLYVWLRSVRTRTVEPVPVLVVINKSEPPHDLRLDEARLIREFPNIRGFIRTSCRDPKKHANGGRGMEELRKTIVDVIRADLPHVRDQFPLSYFNIKKNLIRAARTALILDTKNYRKKCAQEGVTDESEQDSLLKLFDCIGLVVKYDETTLLDPNWLTTAVYRILTHEAVIASQGEFARSDLGTLLGGLQAKDYPRSRWPFIVEMMKRFGLSFELSGSADRFLVPNQLPEVDPQPPWDDADALRFRYDYKHTPSRGLLPRLIVQAHHQLTSPRVVWISGAMFQIQSCEVLVRMNRQERQAHLSVRGPWTKRRDALTVVREHFAFVHALNRLEPGVDFTAQVPVTVPGKPDAAFKFEELETDERNGVTRRWYAGHDEPFIVKNLLDGVGREPIASLDLERRKQVSRDIHIHGNVGSINQGTFHQLQQGKIVSNIDVNTGGGNIVGTAIGYRAQVTAEKIISDVRQQLPKSPSGAEELAAILKAALEALGKEPLETDARVEAEETVKKIEKEMAKPVPNGRLVKGWLGTIDAVSETVGKVVRSAGAIAAQLV